MTAREQTDPAAAAITATVAEMWRRALNLDRDIPEDADFVALGGDSLLLLSIIDELEARYDAELDVEAVVADLTVRGMARAALAAGAREATSAG